MGTAHARVLLLAGLATATSSAAGIVPTTDERLHAYCSSVRATVPSDFVDPTTLRDRAAYRSAQPNIILGKRVHLAGRQLNLEGTLVLGMLISIKGQAGHFVVLEPSAHAELDQKAIQIMREGVFTPATLRRKGVKSCIVLTITFRNAQ